MMTVTCLGVVVIMGTAWILRAPARAMVGETYCGMEEHVHDDECYEAVLICGYGETGESGESAGEPEPGGTAESPTGEAEGSAGTKESTAGTAGSSAGTSKSPDSSNGMKDSSEAEGASGTMGDAGTQGTASLHMVSESHQHTDSCYVQQRNLICGQEEAQGHTHTDSCYSVTTKKELTCGKEESEDHVHEDSCYTTMEQRELTCGQQEGGGHTHGDSCYETVSVLACGIDTNAAQGSGQGAAGTEDGMPGSAGAGNGQETAGTESGGSGSGAEAGSGQETAGTENGGSGSGAGSGQETAGTESGGSGSGAGSGQETAGTEDGGSGGAETESGTESDAGSESSEETDGIEGDMGSSSEEEEPMEPSDGHIHTEECYQLILACELEEHEHVDECYEKPTFYCAGERHIHTDNCLDEDGRAVCGYADFAVHTHGEECYGSKGTVICPLREAEIHAHTAECYRVDAESGTEELVCAREEVILHVHEETCYNEQGRLVCGAQQVLEHVHGEECFIRPETRPEAQEEQTEQIFEGEGFRVTAVYGRRADIPDTAILLAEQVTEEADAEHYAQRAAEYREIAGEESAPMQALLKIGFYIGEKEVEPKQSVAVTVQFLDENGVEDGEPVTVIHFGDEGAEQLEGSDVRDGSTTFEIGHFSEIAIGFYTTEGNDSPFYCVEEMHFHTANCLDDSNVPICGYADFAVHVHGRECYDTEGELACPLEEVEAHVHTDECYGEAAQGGEPGLVCGREEVRLHTHGGECFNGDGRLVCEEVEILEHVHSEACYVEPEEKVEDLTKQTFQGEGFLVTAVYGKDADIPVKAALSVEQMTEEDEGGLYAARKAEYEALTGEEGAPMRALLKIGFFIGEREIRPASPVSITVELQKAGSEEDKALTVIRFSGDGAEWLEDSVSASGSFTFQMEGLTEIAIGCKVEYDKTRVEISKAFQYENPMFTANFKVRGNVAIPDELLGGRVWEPSEDDQNAPDGTGEPGAAGAAGGVAEPGVDGAGSGAGEPGTAGAGSGAAEWDDNGAGSGTVEANDARSGTVGSNGTGAGSGTVGSNGTGAGSGTVGSNGTGAGSGTVGSNGTGAGSGTVEPNGSEAGNGTTGSSGTEAGNGATEPNGTEAGSSPATPEADTAIVTEAELPGELEFRVDLLDENTDEYKIAVEEEGKEPYLNQILSYYLTYDGVRLDLSDCEVSMEVTPTQALIDYAEASVGTSPEGDIDIQAEVTISLIDMGGNGQTAEDAGAEPGDGAENDAADMPGGDVPGADAPESAGDAQEGGVSAGGNAAGAKVLAAEPVTRASMDSPMIVTLNAKGTENAVETRIDSQANPRFTVEYYAEIDTFAQSGGTTKPITVIDTSGKALPKNGETRPKRNIYVSEAGKVLTEAKLTEIYSSEEHEYIKSPGLVYFNKISENKHYELQKIHVQRKGETAWEEYSCEEQEWHFTNKPSTQEARPNDFILVTADATIRLIYSVTEKEEEVFGAEFYDYDVSDGHLYNGQGVEVSRGEATTHDSGDAWYMYTNRQGINSNLPDQTLGFGNSESTLLTTMGEIVGNRANAQNAAYGSPTFGLVKGLKDGKIQYADGVKAPNLFNDGDAEGKENYAGNLLFRRRGDTYTLTGAQVMEDGVVVSGVEGVDTFKRQRDNWNKSYYFAGNDFYPLDNVHTAGKGGHDLMFGTASGSPLLKSFSNKNNPPDAEETKKLNVPVSDDGQNHNHYFGMRYEVEFDLAKDYVGPLEYLFYGDDDMWVFLEGEGNPGTLICDIGGVHTSVGEYVDLWDYIKKGEEGHYKLTFYYTERGASGSTCWMQFTLPSVSFATTEQATGKIEIRKKVTGNETDEEFGFTVNFSDKNGNPLMNDYSYTKYYPDEDREPDSDILIWDNGKFTLRAGEYIVISYLPVDSKYTITEVGPVEVKPREPGDDLEWTVGAENIYLPEVTVGGATEEKGIISGDIKDNGKIDIEYNNVQVYELPETGGNGSNLYTMAGAVLLMGGAGLMYRKKFRERRG